MGFILRTASGLVVLTQFPEQPLKGALVWACAMMLFSLGRIVDEALVGRKEG